MENIIDLYKNPLNQGQLENASTTHRAHNPLCGDEVTIDLLISEEKVEDVRQRGVGCAISQAAVSLLTEEIKGMGLKEVMEISKDEVIDMLGIELGPVRLKCALIGLEAIHEAIKSFQKNH